MKYRPRVVDLVPDHGSPIPLYLQLKQHMVHLISSGGWQPGAAVPSVRQLASALGMSTATVQRAYNELRAQGLLIGQAGRGVFVGDLATGLSQRPGERSEMLRALLARSVSHARSLGFGETEIIAAVRGLISNGTTPDRTARVVFIGAQPEFVEKYCALLRESLIGLDPIVEGVVLADLERGDVNLDSFEPIRVIVSLIGTFADVRRLVGYRATPLFGLVVDLTEATQHALVHLSPDQTVALITEQQYIPSARAILRQYLYPETEGRVRWAALSNRQAVRRLVQERSVVVHTLGAKRIVEEYAPPNTQLIELEYLPNSASLARLRALLASNDLTEFMPDTCVAPTERANV